MFHVAKACYPVNDATYASRSEVAGFVTANYGAVEWIDDNRFKSMAIIYDVVPGENPIALRRKAGTSTSRRTARKAPARPMSAERHYDLTYNEGAEGYNPHRIGDVPTYWRGDRR